MSSKVNINENEATSLSQKKRILAWMLKGHSITPLEALNMFGCLRLGARIADIKEMGFDVKSHFVSTATQKHVKQYYL